MTGVLGVALSLWWTGSEGGAARATRLQTREQCRIGSAIRTVLYVADAIAYRAWTRIPNIRIVAAVVGLEKATFPAASGAKCHVIPLFVSSRTVRASICAFHT